MHGVWRRVAGAFVARPYGAAWLEDSPDLCLLANVEQTEQSLLGIKIAFGGAPLVAAILVVILLQFYKLKKGWEHRESVIGHGVEPQ